MRTDLFDFELPEERIALYPLEPRDAARLLVVDPRAGGLRDLGVRDLPDLLEPGDALVFNDTRVIPAALDGVRVREGVTAKVAFNLIKRVDGTRWRAFARPAKRLEVGDRVRFGHANTSCLLGALDATVASRLDAGEVELAFDLTGDELDRAIAAVGEMPLPPYIALKRPPGEADRQSYQTMFAAKDGAVAAPTAGLHFTERLIAAIDARGIERHTVTLHVGAGTFLPVKAEDTAGHQMHSELGSIDATTAAALNAVRARGNRVVAVGTTSLRTLESAAADDGRLGAWAGETSIFITPGYRFRVTGALMTNFHLPRSTLFMLVSALSGLETMQAAYAHAIQHGYRFYSYGDACLLFPAAETG
ncbi:MAG: tRNA preQ1(34) S-adenosylmethionine ribosyltransferase-isomerase QueA [Hyphomicrobium sp. 32-62-53]|nr:MAG: tRNA preQ1(34) S-adenosylmethionine ribosyltransferase-isomerase QueA [Hyphomicrobium sp. 12-62-95]OYX99599.1 MAG: tRNA preQ1(34) S-adenosylmethionine ribosyltransferase-isomerase QueA [Hyphomicrobium sp. 32-62-53]